MMTKTVGSGSRGIARLSKAAVWLVALGASCAFLAGVAQAKEEARRGTVRGRFVRLAERQVGEREHLAVVVKPLEGKEQVTFLVPRAGDLAPVARRLKEGQKLLVTYVVEEGQRWATGIRTEAGGEGGEKPAREKESERREGERREGERGKGEPRDPRRADLTEMLRMIRHLHELAVKMEGRLAKLEAENARLKKHLQELRGGRAERGREGREPRRQARAGIPDGMRGFRGMLRGTLERKLDRGFVLKVAKITRVWKQSKADRPEAAVGKSLAVIIRPGTKRSEHFLRTVKQLQPGDEVVVEVFHLEGNALTVVEVLRKAE